MVYEHHCKRGVGRGEGIDEGEGREEE